MPDFGIDDYQIIFDNQILQLFTSIIYLLASPQSVMIIEMKGDGSWSIRSCRFLVLKLKLLRGDKSTEHRVIVL